MWPTPSRPLTPCSEPLLVIDMTPVLAFLAALIVTLIVIMAKLSELNGRLTVVEKKIDTLLAATPTDPDLPPDLEATVTSIETNLAAVTPAP